jgi:DNA replication protein DnaC
LVYCGSSGIGKTYFCAALTEWAIDNFGSNWRYWKENDLLKKLRDSMDSIRGDYLDVLRYMIDDDFLILDDVGSSTKHTDWREEVLFEILDYRYNNMKPTLITSNFTSEDFKKYYHFRVHSRLFANDNTIIEIPNGVDFRLEELSRIENKIEGYKKD